MLTLISGISGVAALAIAGAMGGSLIGYLPAALLLFIALVSRPAGRVTGGGGSVLDLEGGEGGD